MEFNLKNKWVVITGASSGFGAAAARAFARLGCNVLLGARRVSRLESVAHQCVGEGAGGAYFHSLDVSRSDSVTAFFDWLKQKTPQLSVLINNAGGALGLDTVASGKDEDWEGMLQSNVLGILRVTRAALPMIPHDSGASIINIGSVAGRVAYEGGAAYCAAKAGELQITRALRLELCGSGIRICSLDPGMAETEFSVVRFKGDAERARQVYQGVDPLTAEDLAETMVWIATRPPHVNIDEMVIKCVDQAAIHKVHRRTGTST